MLWLDERHAPRRARLPDERRRHRGARAALPGAEVVAVDLPHWRGPRRGHAPALADQPARRRPRARLPAAAAGTARRAARASAASRSSRSPTRSSTRWAATCSRSRPGRVLALDGNPETRRRLEAAGVEVLRLRGRRAVAQGRRRPDVPHAPARARLSASSTASSGVCARATPSTSQPRLQDHDLAAERAGEADLRERPPATADRDHGVAGRDDGQVARVADAGHDRVVDPLVRVAPGLAREDPDRRRRPPLRPARRRGHHLAEPAADERARRARRAAGRPARRAPRARRPEPITATWTPTLRR